MPVPPSHPETAGLGSARTAGTGDGRGSLGPARSGFRVLELLQLGLPGTHSPFAVTPVSRAEVGAVCRGPLHPTPHKFGLLLLYYYNLCSPHCASFLQYPWSPPQEAIHEVCVSEKGWLRNKKDEPSSVRRQKPG